GPLVPPASRVALAFVVLFQNFEQRGALGLDCANYGATLMQDTQHFIKCLVLSFPGKLEEPSLIVRRALQCERLVSERLPKSQVHTICHIRTEDDRDFFVPRMCGSQIMRSVERANLAFTDDRHAIAKLFDFSQIV